LVVPLIATAGRVLVGSKNLKPLTTKILNPKQSNMDFIKDYGKKSFDNYEYGTKDFKKYFDKVKDDPKDKLKHFLNHSTEKLGEQNSELEVPLSSNVNFDIPDPSVEISENDLIGEQGNEKQVPFGFKKITGLEDLIKDGRTFGSIPLLLFVILFIIIAIRPVGNNNETRLTLAFKSLLGMTQLDDLTDPEDIPEGNNGTPFEFLKNNSDVLLPLAFNRSPIIKPIYVKKGIDLADDFSETKAVDFLSNFSQQLNAGKTIFDGVSGLTGLIGGIGK
jgi:hypothetical protein